MSEHTPGPWNLEDEETMGCRTIVTTADIDLSDGRSREVCTTHGLANDQEDEANACLIAAAPDLLAAVKSRKAELDALKWGQPFPGRPHAVMDAAEAAIAKATGAA
jgi:hypothetical protein